MTSDLSEYDIEKPVYCLRYFKKDTFSEIVHSVFSTEILVKEKMQIVQNQDMYSDLMISKNQRFFKCKNAEYTNIHIREYATVV